MSHYRHAHIQTKLSQNFRPVAPPRSSYNAVVTAIKGISCGSIASVEQIGESLIKNNDLDFLLPVEENQSNSQRSISSSGICCGLSSEDTDVADDDPQSNLRLMNYDLVSCKRLEQLYSTKQQQTRYMGPSLSSAPRISSLQNFSEA